jgi:hypothetical protein
MCELAAMFPHAKGIFLQELLKAVESNLSVLVMMWDKTDAEQLLSSPLSLIGPVAARPKPQ